MDETDHLRLPYIIDAQAQKHVTHNEALRTLDAIVHLAVIDRDQTDPPASPAAGARYIVADPAGGGWTGREGQVAAWQDGAWMFHTPRAGWTVYVEDEQVLLVHDGNAWQPVSGNPSVNPVPLVGVNATADTTNRLAVSAPAALFTHAGNDHRLVVNKAGSADTGSVVFQSNHSGRAEFGLSGSDDFSVKVSGDGSTWNDALTVDAATGAVSFPNTILGSGFTPTHWLATAADPNQNCASGDRVILTVNPSEGGADNRSAFVSSSPGHYVVPETGTYFCALVVSLDAISSGERAGMRFLVSSDLGATWNDPFRALASNPLSEFSANFGILSLNQNDRIAADAVVTGTSPARFRTHSRIALLRIA